MKDSLNLMTLVMPAIGVIRDHESKGLIKFNDSCHADDRRHLGVCESKRTMYIYKQHHYYTYIVTNPERSVLYTGVTNNLPQRLKEHWSERGKPESFTGRYYCYNLIYFEYFPYIKNAIAREKEIKGWRRQKKLDLIKTTNPHWTFLNPSICGGWPPKGVVKRE